VRVVFGSRGQSPPQRVLDEILRLPSRISLASDAVLEISCLPRCALLATQCVDATCGTRFHSLNASSEQSTLQLKQPMKVVGHDYPRLRIYMTFPLDATQFVDDGMNGISVEERRATIRRHSGYRVEGSDRRVSTQEQA
jgi:hypothetical protein